MADKVRKVTKVKRTDKDFDLFFEPASPAKPSAARAVKKQDEWWMYPVAVVLLMLLFLMGYLATNSISKYSLFREMRGAVDRSTFYPGITVDGQDMSGYTRAEAMTLFAEREQSMRDAYQVTLTSDNQQWVLAAEEIGYKNDYRQIVSSAWAIGRYGSLEDRYVNAVATSDAKARSFTITETVDRDVLKQKTDQIADQLTINPVNAKIQSFDTATRQFVFTKTQDGIVVDKEKLANSVMRAIDEGRHQVEIVREPVSPKRTEVELNAIYGQISTATTNASTSTKNRLKNIELACKALDGKLIKPGETFSFNGTVGQRTTDRGYKSAGAIENGIMTQQVGGGICQVSTTLFNAVVKADLAIVERKPHSRPSTYVDIGKDAVVDWPNQDFKFKNNTENPVYLSARLTSNGRVVIEVYGRKLENGMSIILESKKTATIKPGDTRYVKDSNLSRGEQVTVEGPRNGYKAETYKVYLDASGQEIRRETLCQSTYASSGAVVKVGG